PFVSKRLDAHDHLRSFPTRRSSDLSLELVLRRLSAPDPRDWGHASLGARARLMVLCLLVLGRPNEALEILEQFEHSLGVKDQMLPSFSAFAGWCRSYVQQSGGIAAPAG